MLLFNLPFFKIRILSLSFYQIKRPIQLVKPLWWEDRARGRREGGWEMAREESSTDSLGTSLPFLWVYRDHTLPKQSSRAARVPHPCTPKAVCQPKPAEQRKHGRVHPWPCISKPAFQLLESLGSQSAQKRKNILRWVCRSKHRKSWMPPPSLAMPGRELVVVQGQLTVTPNLGTGAGGWGSVLCYPNQCFPVRSSCLGCTGRHQRAQTCRTSSLCHHGYSCGHLEAYVCCSHL